MSFFSPTVFQNCLLTLYLIGPPSYILQKFVDAPYGRHYRHGWGPTISPTLAWSLYESPALWLPVLLFPFGQHATNPKSLILIFPFLVHYFNRTVIYPFRLHSNKNTKNHPIFVAFLATMFNVLNAYLQTRWLSHYKDYDSDELFWCKFWGGMGLFLWGMWINIWADGVLIGLKRKGGGYKIPRGGWFELVSCPNYCGELIEWLGWSLMTWSWSAFGFFIFSAATLVPRALANHKWYLEKFKDYPKNRKAVIPFLY